MATLGAFITICTIAFGPFFQQLVDYPTRNVEQANLTAVASRNTHHTTNDFRKLSSVITAGLVFGSEGLDRDPSCPTAWCSWDSYKSVGWCGKCKRIDNGYLRDADCTVKAQLDHPTKSFCGLWVQSSDRPDVQGQEPLMTLSVHTDFHTDWGDGKLVNTYDSIDWGNEIEFVRELTYSVFDSGDFVADDNLVIPHPFLKFRHATFNQDEEVLQNLTLSDQNPLRLDQFHECVLTFCERGYTTNTTDGITTSMLKSTDYGEFFRATSASWCWRPEGATRDLELTSFDEGLTYQDESQRAFCSTRSSGIHEYRESKRRNVPHYPLVFQSDMGK